MLSAGHRPYRWKCLECPHDQIVHSWDDDHVLFIYKETTRCSISIWWLDLWPVSDMAFPWSPILPLEEIYVRFLFPGKRCPCHWFASLFSFQPLRHRHIKGFVPCIYGNVLHQSGNKTISQRALPVLIPSIVISSFLRPKSHGRIMILTRLMQFQFTR